MNTVFSRKNSISGSLFAVSLILSLGAGTAAAVTDDVTSPIPHSDGVGATISDTAITAQVKTKLIGDHRLKKSDISVMTTNGVVTLDGTASNSSAKSVAEKFAKSIEGVKSVDNNLVVPGDNKHVTKAKRVLSDSWITTKVKAEILADSTNKGFEVNVNTVRGVVILEGRLDSQDAIDHVKDIAAKVEGVKSVDTKNLTITVK